MLQSVSRPHSHLSTLITAAMSKSALILVFLAVLLAPVSAESRLGERLRAAAAERRTGDAPVEYGYGSEPLQRLDFWKSKSTSAPLIIFVHGGGWKRGDKRGATGDKATYYPEQGYAFASINYRLVPAVTVQEQAQDVATAIAYLIGRAETLGFDGKRVVLMGHSAGAHLSALVGTDISYLKKAGLTASALRGVIPLDGACYDVPRQIAEGGEFMHDTYLQAFTADPATQNALSPTKHAAAPNAPAFLILHVQRIDGAAQSKALGEALRKAGTTAEVHGFPGVGLKGHAEINRSLGDPAYPATLVVDAWLKRVLEK